MAQGIGPLTLPVFPGHCTGHLLHRKWIKNSGRQSERLSRWKSRSEETPSPPPWQASMSCYSHGFPRFCYRHWTSASVPRTSHSTLETLNSSPYSPPTFSSTHFSKCNSRPVTSTCVIRSLSNVHNIQSGDSIHFAVSVALLVNY